MIKLTVRKSGRYFTRYIVSCYVMLCYTLTQLAHETENYKYMMYRE